MKQTWYTSLSSRWLKCLVLSGDYSFVENIWLIFVYLHKDMQYQQQEKRTKRLLILKKRGSHLANLLNILFMIPNIGSQNRIRWKGFHVKQRVSDILGLWAIIGFSYLINKPFKTSYRPIYHSYQLEQWFC